MKIAFLSDLQLVTDYRFDPFVQQMLDAYDWYVMPCVNPDGYQYTHERVMTEFHNNLITIIVK